MYSLFEKGPVPQVNLICLSRSTELKRKLQANGPVAKRKTSSSDSSDDSSEEENQAPPAKKAGKALAGSCGSRKRICSLPVLNG